MIAINPLHALFAQDRQRASPYYPSDRLFLDPIYLDIARSGDFFSAPSAGQLVDYPAVHALKQDFLERCFRDAEDLAARQPSARTLQNFERFIENGGDALLRFACFETINEQRGGEDWRRWPQPLRDGERSRSPPSRAKTPAASAIINICNGCASVNWRRRRGTPRRPASRSAFAAISRLARRRTAARVGAMRRAFSRAFRSALRPIPLRARTIWGLPPPNPLSWKADGCESFGELLRANMRHAGALRIDHAMGVARSSSCRREAKRWRALIFLSA